MAARGAHRRRPPAPRSQAALALLLMQLLRLQVSAESSQGDEVSLQNRTHLYRLRAGPLNGRLALPAPDSSSDPHPDTNLHSDSDSDSHSHSDKSCGQLEAMSPSLQLKRPEEPQQRPASDSILSLIDEFDSKIVTNRTKAQLSCDSGEMVLRLNFSDPFKGVVYPDHNRLSACRFFGDGHQHYELRLPLRGCGTRQVSPRVFVNDVIVRFHRTLELEEDEVKTLICRYPPPLAPAPADAPSSSSSSSANDDVKSQFELIDASKAGDRRLGNSNLETLADNNLLLAPRDPIHPRHSGNLLQLEPQPARPAGGFGPLERLSSIELLFLTSALMFLVLLALALATSYYCFRRNRVRGSKRRASAILGARRLARSPLVVAGGHPQPYYPQPFYHSQRPPSSPGSELSGRGLLADPNHTYGGHLNAGFAPDAGQQQQTAYGYGRRDQLAPAMGTAGGRRSAAPGTYQLARQRPAPGQVLARNSHYADNGAQQAAQLMRAKSLSSMEHQHRHAWPVLGHQLDSYDHPHKQSNYRKRQRRLEQAAASQVHTFSSESDDLEEAQRPGASILRAHKPKIVLKSIEDSYITNLTEIHQQEYIKCDSTRPLSLAQWRSMQPARLGASMKQQDASAWSPNSSPPPPPPPPAEVKTLSPDSSRQFNTVDSRYANLRSLTELDVDFAKAAQLLHPNPVASTKSALRPTASLGQLAGSDNDDDDDKEETLQSHWRRPNRDPTDAANKTNTDQSLSRQRRLSSSVPIVAMPEGGDQHQGQRQQTTRLKSPLQPQSPDLIISPDYDLTTTRLELEPTNSSHNSVSYV